LDLGISRGMPGNTWQGGYDAGYRCRLHDGQAQARQHASMPVTIWRGLIELTHPDHHQESPILPIADDTTQGFLVSRPTEVTHGR
jgi:hypothetical protein